VRATFRDAEAEGEATHDVGEPVLAEVEAR
jgi:hypothetical protein